MKGGFGRRAPSIVLGMLSPSTCSAINGSLGFGDKSPDFFLSCKIKGFDCITGSHASVLITISSFK